MEFLPHKVTTRFMREHNSWPVFQIGPGVLSVNTVPPYGGWSQFVPTIRDGVEALWAAYPVPERYLRIEGVSLRYVDAFDARHGAEQPGAFVRDVLKLAGPVPEAVKRHAGANAEDVVQTGEMVTPLTAPTNAFGRIGVAQGVADGRPSLLLEFSVHSGKPMDDASPDKILAWCSESHYVLSDWFESIVPESVKATFGRKLEV